MYIEVAYRLVIKLFTALILGRELRYAGRLRGNLVAEHLLKVALFENSVRGVVVGVVCLVAHNSSAEVLRLNSFDSLGGAARPVVSGYVVRNVIEIEAVLVVAYLYTKSF